jgi:hypothetical protein
MISSYKCHANASNSQSLETHKHVYIILYYIICYLFWLATITIEPSQQVQELILPLTIDICYVDFDVDFQFGFWLP